MKSYVTTKVVLAEPQNDPKNPEIDLPGYKVVYPDGYESWCPKEVFERTSREVIATERSLIFQGVPPPEEDPEFAEVGEATDYA